MIYVFDGSIKGIFSCVYRAIKLNESPFYIVEQQSSFTNFEYDEIVNIKTAESAFQKVFSFLKKYAGESVIHDIYYAFRSASTRKFGIIFSFIKKTIERKENLSVDFYCVETKDLYELIKDISDETKSNKNNNIFSRKNDFFIAKISPRNKILELLTPYFIQKFDCHPFVIIDSGRNVAVVFDGLERYYVKMNKQTLKNFNTKLNSSNKPLTNSLNSSKAEHFLSA